MKWLHLKTILAIHKMQIAEHGGSDGVRDIALLESALARPQNIEAYEPDADIAKLAAAIGFGIAKNHPFFDGNKRTALAATRTFLLLNGFSPDANQQEKYLTFLALADGSLSEDEVAAWLRERLVPERPDGE
jgi:death-on-curing protein